MGGKAFSTSTTTLPTPRLPPPLYHSLLNSLTTLLLTLYTHVSAPPPAPAKPSHGDIDLLVCTPLTSPTSPITPTSPTPPTSTTLSTLLSAVRTISTPPSYSFAIPHPTIPSSYIQIDIRVCENLEHWKWSLFHHAYGDLWNLLGTTIRPWGVMINDKGLQLRIEEISAIDRKRALVFLTRDTRTVCAFLGMDCGRLGIDGKGLIHAEAGGFSCMEDIYSMVTRLRLFRREAYVRTTLKANDRKRMAQREGYRVFVDEWLPAHPDIEGKRAEGSGLVGGGLAGGEYEVLTKEGVMEEVFERFGVKGEYESRLREWREEREMLRVKKEAKEERKRVAGEEEEYADAWMGALGVGGGKEILEGVEAG